MSLLSRLREKQAGRFATATPATVATQAGARGRTVASVATVAVANPRKSIPEPIAPPAKVGAGDTATASRWGLINIPDREPLTVASSPAAIHAEVLDTHPSALAAEPIEPGRRQPGAPLAGDQEPAVLAWLLETGDTDQAIVAEVSGACRRDVDARRYVLERAESRLTNTSIADCASCRHRRSPGGTVRYCASGRSDLPLAYGDGHPLRRLPDDQGHCCTQWSGLIQRGVE